MADRTRTQLIADLAEAERRTNSQIHDKARRILAAAPVAIQRADVGVRVLYVTKRLVPWLSMQEQNLLDSVERAKMLQARERVQNVVAARLEAEDRAHGRPQPVAVMA